MNTQVSKTNFYRIASVRNDSFEKKTNNRTTTTKKTHNSSCDAPF